MKKKIVIILLILVSIFINFSGDKCIKKYSDTDKNILVTNDVENVDTLDGIGKIIAIGIVSLIGVVTTIYLRKNNLGR